MTDFFVDPNIAVAHTIHTDFYNSPQVFELCKERIFAPSYQFVGHADLVPESESVFPLVLLESYLSEPLLLTRDKVGDIRLLSNVCTHRGNLLAEKACKAARLRCRYHGRTFGLDGSFIFSFSRGSSYEAAAVPLEQLAVCLPEP